MFFKCAKITVLRWLVLLPGFLLPLQSQAYDLFMQVAGVTGEGPKGLIALTSFQWGVSRGISSSATGGASRETSAPAFSEVTISKQMDSASPQLAALAAAGSSGLKCVLTIKDHTTGNALYTLTLDNVLFTGYSLSTGGDRPSETLSLNYTKITWVYQSLDSNGATNGPSSSPMGWDIETGKPVQ